MNSKVVFKNKTLLFASLIFIFLSLTIPIVFAPIIYSLPIVIQLSTLIPMSMVFGCLSFQWRKSTLYTVSEITKTNKYNQNIAIILVMLVYSFIVTIILFIIIFLLANGNLLLTDWMTSIPDPDGQHVMFYLSNLNWTLIIYTQIVNVFLIFSFCFFVQRITTDQRAFYSIVFFLLVLLFIFGGTFNNSFDAPIDPALNNVPMWNKKFIIPEEMYYFYLFLPLYATGQQIAFTSSNFWHDYTVWVWIPQYEVNAWKWNILWIMPYIQMLVFLLVGVLISKFRKK